MRLSKRISEGADSDFGENKTSKFLETDEGRQMQFKLNHTAADLDLLKHMFTDQTYSQINQQSVDIQQINYQMEIFKMSVDAAAKQEDILNINNRLKEYAK